MKEGILEIFQGNRELLKKIDRALVYFREQEFEKALVLVAEMTDDIRRMTDAVIQNRQYFELVSTDSVLEMLTGIVNAKKNRDYILLADLLELQMVSFICGVQELIITREDFSVFDERAEKRNRGMVKKKLLEAMTLEELFLQEAPQYAAKVAGEMDEELSPQELLEGGYRVEFTTCGEMTVGCPDRDGNTIYLHTNHCITRESMMAAGKWLKPDKKRYIVYGLGLGYVVREMLLELPKQAVLEVYESDMNLIKLACAFADVDSWIEDERLRLIYDPDCDYISRRLQQFDAGDAVCIHYPSLCCVNDEESREMLLDFLPWARRMEQI